MEAIRTAVLSRVAGQPSSAAGLSNLKDEFGQGFARHGLGLTFLVGVVIPASLYPDFAGHHTASINLGAILTLAAIVGGYMVVCSAWPRALRPGTYSHGRIRNHPSAPKARLSHRAGHGHQVDPRIETQTSCQPDPDRPLAASLRRFQATISRRLCRTHDCRGPWQDRRRELARRAFLARIDVASIAKKGATKY